MLSKLSDCDIDIKTTVIHLVQSVRDLGLYTDNALIMMAHISKVASRCFFQPHKICQVHQFVGLHSYYNSLLARVPRSSIQPLQHVMNAAAQVVIGLSTQNDMKPTLKQLHSLPVEVEYRIPQKLCLYMHYV